MTPLLFGVVPVILAAFWARGRFESWVVAGRSQPRSRELRRGIVAILLSSVTILGGLGAASTFAAPKGTDGGLGEAFGLGLAVLAATLFVVLQARGAAHLIASQRNRS